MDRSRVSIAQLISMSLAIAGASACATETTSGTDSSGSCGTQTVVTPVVIEDWAVDAQAYEDIQASAELYNGAPWDERSQSEQCRIACAHASGNLDAFGNDDYSSLELYNCELTIPTMDTDGLLLCDGDRVDEYVCLGGRAPLAWSPGRDAAQGLAAQLDAMATMEAVSITAFEELAAQLERLGAPTTLIERCRAAARDEARHLELLEQLGGQGPAQLPAPAPAETSALAIALHNAVEGCVHETWAALLAHHQSEHAADPNTRRTFAEIARDETRHAQLAWDLHDCLCALLEPEQAAQVEAARAGALAELERDAVQQAFATSPSLRASLGLPDARRARAMAGVFGRQLAAAA